MRLLFAVRHPAACFASCMDFFATNFGAMPPASRSLKMDRTPLPCRPPGEDQRI
jgi:hypothetical protein